MRAPGPVLSTGTDPQMNEMQWLLPGSSCADCSKGCNGDNSNNNANNNIHYSLIACYVLGAVLGVSHSICQHVILARQDWVVTDLRVLQEPRHTLLEGVTDDPSHLFTEDGK